MFWVGREQKSFNNKYDQLLFIFKMQLLFYFKVMCQVYVHYFWSFLRDKDFFNFVDNLWKDLARQQIGEKKRGEKIKISIRCSCEFWVDPQY